MENTKVVMQALDGNVKVVREDVTDRFFHVMKMVTYYSLWIGSAEIPCANQDDAIARYGIILSAINYSKR